MHKSKRIIAIVPAYNEEVHIARVVERTDFRLVDHLLVVDDASTDGTADVARSKGANVLTLPQRSGVGAAIRAGIQLARDQGFDLAVVMAGNNKDNPSEIPRLLDPICDEGFDFVIGSRYLSGGGCGGDMPFYRRVATRLHPFLLGLFARKKLTESTNGFRAFRLDLFDDPRIKLDQPWLDAYGLEVYMLWKVLKLGYKHKEVACTKTYPLQSQSHTKMTPIIGWWSILRPVFLLGLGIRQ